MNMPPETRERLARTAGVARATLDALLCGCPIPPSARKAIAAVVAELGWTVDFLQAGAVSTGRAQPSAKINTGTGR